MNSLRKILVTISVVLSLSSTNILPAQNAVANNPKTMDISIDAGQLLFGMLPLRFGFAVSDKMGLGISGGGRLFSLGKTNVLGLYAGVDVKFYLTAKPYEDGWFVKPGLTLGYNKYGDKGGASFSGFVVGGYNWIWDSGFNIGLGLGFQFLYSSEDIIPYYSLGLRGLAPSLDFSVGWAF